jgi:hypothetical protein
MILLSRSLLVLGLLIPFCPCEIGAGKVTQARILSLKKKLLKKIVPLLRKKPCKKL